MAKSLLEDLRFAMGLAPVADYDAGGVSSDIVNCEDYDKVVFLVVKGVGVTGTGVLTIEASDDVSASNTTAVPYRSIEVTGADVTSAAPTERAAAGFTMTAGSATLIAAEVDAVELSKAGYKYVRATLTESVDSPVLAGIVVLMGSPRYSPPKTTTVLT